MPTPVSRIRSMAVGPVHGQRNGIGDGHRQGGLDGFFRARRQGHRRRNTWNYARGWIARDPSRGSPTISCRSPLRSLLPDICHRPLHSAQPFGKRVRGNAVGDQTGEDRQDDDHRQKLPAGDAFVHHNDRYSGELFRQPEERRIEKEYFELLLFLGVLAGPYSCKSPSS